MMRRTALRGMTRIGLFALLSLMLGGLGASALAQGPACGAGRGAKGHPGKEAPACPQAGVPCCPDGPQGERFARVPDLTDQQREAMKKLREDGAKAMVPLRKEMLRMQHELRGEMMKDQPNLARLQDLTRQAGELRTRIQMQRLEQRLAARNVLTAEQRDRLLLQRPGRPGMGPHMGWHMRGHAWGGPGACVPGCCPGGPSQCMPGGAQMGGRMGCQPGAAMSCPPGCCPGGPSQCVPGAPGAMIAPDCPAGQAGCGMMSWNDEPSFDPDEGFEGEEGDDESLFW